MKHFLLIMLLLFTTTNFSYSQISFKPVKVNKSSRFYQQPRFPGGERMLTQYLSQHIIYPKNAVDKRIQGKVYAEFTVEIDGTISDVRIYKGIDEECDSETIRVIESMPKWIPAKQKGENIRVKHALPVLFFLPKKRRN